MCAFKCLARFNVSADSTICLNEGNVTINSQYIINRLVAMSELLLW